MVNPIEMDDLGVHTPILGNQHLWTSFFCSDLLCPARLASRFFVWSETLAILDHKSGMFHSSVKMVLHSKGSGG